MDSNTRPAVSEELVRDAVRRIGDNLGIAIEDTQKRRVASEAILRDFAAAVRAEADNRTDVEKFEDKSEAHAALLKAEGRILDLETQLADALYAECPECEGTADHQGVVYDPEAGEGLFCRGPLCGQHGAPPGKVSIVEQARAEIKETVADYEEQISGLIREHEATVRAARAEGRAEAFREAAGMIYAKPMSQHGYSEMLRTKAEEKP